MRTDSRWYILFGVMLLAVLSIGTASFAQDESMFDRYGFGFVTGSVSPSEIVFGSPEVDLSPGGTDIYLSSLAGLPADILGSYLGAYDLLGGGRLYELSTAVGTSASTNSTFGVACSSIQVYKVNRDATVELYSDHYCAGNVLYIRNSGSTATFLLFA